MLRHAFSVQRVSWFASGTKGFDKLTNPAPSVFELPGERNHKAKHLGARHATDDSTRIAADS